MWMWRSFISVLSGFIWHHGLFIHFDAGFANQTVSVVIWNESDATDNESATTPNEYDRKYANFMYRIHYLLLRTCRNTMNPRHGKMNPNPKCKVNRSGFMYFYVNTNESGSRNHESERKQYVSASRNHESAHKNDIICTLFIILGLGFISVHCGHIPKQKSKGRATWIRGRMKCIRDMKKWIRT